MNMKKLLAGGLAGGIAYFLLGWLVYGTVLMSYMEAHQLPGIMKPESEMMGIGMAFMLIANLAWGLLIAYIFMLGNINSLAAGLKQGFIIGLLLMVGMDLGFYAYSNLFDSLQTVLIDIAASTAMTCVGGGVIGFVNSKVN
jgi:hypothetical protein